MNSTLEFTIVLFSVLVSLLMGQIMRDCNFRIFQEKIFALGIGLGLGVIMKIFSLSIMLWVPEYFQYLLWFFLLEKIHTLPKVTNI